jgi:outer membrane protein OmpA-like peptidoglycan-associated protein
MKTNPGKLYQFATGSFLAVTLVALPGCGSMGSGRDSRTEAAARGAAIGAVAGVIAGSTNARSILAGGAVGAVAGVAIDEYMRNQRNEIEARTNADVRMLDDHVMVVALQPEDLFVTGSAQLTSGGRERLANVAAVLNDFPESAVVVRSFTPLTGPAVGDLELAELRATAVRTELAARGVSAARLESVALDQQALRTAGIDVAPAGHLDILVVVNTGAA